LEFKPTDKRSSIFRMMLSRLDMFTLSQLSISLLFFTFLLILPLGTIIFRAFVYNGVFSLHWFASILNDRYFVSFTPTGGKLFEVYGDVMFIWGMDYGIIFNSLIVAAFVTIFCTFIGIVVAFIMARYDFPGKNFFRITLIIPMLATPFVNAYVLGKLFHPRNGFLNIIFYDILHLLPYRIDINGLVGIMVAQTLSFFPIVYLNVFSSLVNIDPSLEEQAENLGAKGFTLFRTVTLPLALPGVMAGATITFIFSMEDLAAPVGFVGYGGNPLAKKVISYYIFQSFTEAFGGTISPETAALSVILLVLSFSGFFMIKRYVSLKSYATVSRGGRWTARLRKIPLPRSLILYCFLGVLTFFSCMPQIGVIILALSDWAISGAFPTLITFEYVQELLSATVSRAIINSLIYSSIAVLIAIIIGSSTSYLVSRSRFVFVDFLDMLATMPISIPGIVLAVGFFLFFAGNFRGTFLDPLIDPAPLIVLAYAIRRMPFAARSIYAGLQQVHISLEEASLSLGASKFYTFIKIVLPLIAVNLIGGALLTFVYAMSEVSTSVTLGALRQGRGPITFYISQVIYGSAAVGTVSIAAALCLLLILVQLIAITFSNNILKQRVAIFGV